VGASRCQGVSVSLWPLFFICWTDRPDRNVVLAYKADQMNVTLEGIVQEKGEEIRAVMLEGQDRQRSYVNYAVKQESLESMYG
jgi:hypothetical protein